LGFNADETKLALPEGQEKLIVERHKTVFAAKSEKTEDITAMFYFNTQGTSAPTLFLLPKLKNLPEKLHPYRDDRRA
jgi:hypothetical protein